jgi:hypothetical protein
MVSTERRAARRGDGDVVVSKDSACRPRGSMLDINGLSPNRVHETAPCHFLRLRAVTVRLRFFETGPRFVVSQLSNLPGMHVEAQGKANSEGRKSPATVRAAFVKHNEDGRAPETARGGRRCNV